MRLARTSGPRVYGNWMRAGTALAVATLLVACGAGHNKAASDTSTPTGALATSAVKAAGSPTLPAADDTSAAGTDSAMVVPASIDSTTALATTALATTAVVNAPTVTPALTAALPIPVEIPLDSEGQEPVIEIGTIEIPKIGINMTLYDGIRLTTLNRGPGHWPGTAMPGQVGNVVIAGHRVSRSKPFRHIDELAAGDQVIFTTAEGRFVYDYVSQEIVDPTALQIVDQTPEKTATLFACHPPGSTSQRIVIHLVLDDSSG